MSRRESVVGFKKTIGISVHIKSDDSVIAESNRNIECAEMLSDHKASDSESAFILPRRRTNIKKDATRKLSKDEKHRNVPDENTSGTLRYLIRYYFFMISSAFLSDSFVVSSFSELKTIKVSTAFSDSSNVGAE